MARLADGSRFSSFAEFETSLKEYQNATNTVFVSTDKKKVSTENKKIADPAKHFPENHKFRFVHYQCKHYGDINDAKRPSKLPRGTGQRTQLSTWRSGCPAELKLSSKKADGLLVIDAS